ncbi:uncharacterized protein MKK02DRAFT_44511 [Dioszegia hungarica]|uniref:SET domain-containing protein n=1 Tax=Dioszegia hungarica TaxID=4972 RepID=A0AA38H7I7_9TREE|nr:uncharacterized protein MKK02DRAFT_44511 [Dioszegia hungarica]KAI9635815.1 hypothetical protein MKK02DRAFT_44511 [Dioszegia hungarica]
MSTPQDPLHASIERTYRQVYSEYHNHKPHFTETLPCYLAATNVSAEVDDAISDYFEQWYDPHHATVLENSSSNRPAPAPAAHQLEVRQAKLQRLRGDGRQIDICAIQQSALLVPASATIPPYRFCRPIDTCVFRETERFAAFTHAIMQDNDRADELTAAYMGRGWLHEQPSRQSDIDIVALETFERLMDKGLDREDIDRSRILPLHSDVIVDLDILRDLPPFPTASTDATGSTSRAKAWQGILPVAAESFVDDPERLHLDAQARLCPRRDCRTFGCQLHSTLTVVKPQPTLRSTEPLTGFDPVGESPCSGSCYRRPAPSDPLVHEHWPEAHVYKLQECLDWLPDTNSCALRTVFPRRSCAELHRKIALLRMNPARNPSQSNDVAIAAPKGCTCHSVRQKGKAATSRSSFCGGESCPCRAAGRECDPELCHPSTEAEDWDSILSESPKPPSCGTCTNMQLQRLPLGPSTDFRVGISKTSGYGLFARVPISNNKPIFEYTGEHIPNAESDNRSLFYAVSKRNYLFDVVGWLGFTLDAGLMGNDARYINTVYGLEAVKRRKINTDAASVEAQGRNRILIRTNKSRQKISAGEELFLDYGEMFTVKSKISQLNSQRERKREEKKERQEKRR